jgi:multidrug efflux pump subunit AcrB
MLLAIGLIAGGRLSFTFFPSPENPIIMANANFVAGTSPERVDAFLEHLEKTLYATDKELDGNLVKVVVSRHGGAIAAGGSIRTNAIKLS